LGIKSDALTICGNQIFHTCFVLVGLAFAIFLAVGAFGNRDQQAVYNRLDFSSKQALQRGVEIRRVAVLNTCTVKAALRFLSASSYLVLEVFNDKEEHLFDLPQNLFSDLFASANSPYETLGDLYQKHVENRKNLSVYRKNKWY
ncbi:MAG: hypothetical protein IKZ28_05985, partial [Clostridia bacterium]|nr:hypothetical protein [Clostridia bacterium]